MPIAENFTYAQDRAAHSVMAFAMDARNMPRGKNDRVCNHCGEKVDVYYCEERLYMVRCLKCHTVSLAYAGNPNEAVEKTIGG